MDFIVRKEYIDKILPFIDKPVIKVITGMRHVGKSTFLKMISQNTLKMLVRAIRFILILKH